MCVCVCTGFRGPPHHKAHCSHIWNESTILLFKYHTEGDTNIQKPIHKMIKEREPKVYLLQWNFPLKSLSYWRGRAKHFCLNMVTRRSGVILISSLTVQGWYISVEGVKGLSECRVAAPHSPHCPRHPPAPCLQSSVQRRWTASQRSPLPLLIGPDWSAPISS